MLWSHSKATAYGYGSLVAGAFFPQSPPWRETGGCNQSQHCKQFANPPSSRTLPTKATHADQCDLQSTDWQARHVEYKLRTPWFQAVPFQQFQALFNSLFKVLFIFPSRYLFAIGLLPVFSFRWNIPPIWGCIPKQPDSSKGYRTAETHKAQTGLSPSMTPPSRGILPGLGLAHLL